MPEFRMLKIDDLHLDTSNPRIARLIEKYGPNPNAEQINLALGAGNPSTSEGGPTFFSLKESIRTNGGVIYPIIVNHCLDCTNLDCTNVVIEGNTRVAIYREFIKQGVTGNWNQIPALVYENLDRAGQDAIRLQAHLVGPRQWDPYSKAKYLNYLRNCDHLPLNQVIDFCGGRKTEVLNYIDAYNDMETYYRAILEDESDFDATRFSAFIELQKPKIKQAISEAGFDLKSFASWVDNRLIDPLSTVRDLPRILSNQKSKEKFFKEGAKEALKELVKDEVGDLSSISFDALVREMINRLRNISFSTIKEMITNIESERTRNVFTLQEELNQTCLWIDKGNE